MLVTSVLNRIKRLVLPVLAAVVIVLAVLVGVARLLLPQVPQYREDIQRIAEAATGFQVEFGQISAGMSRFGPELRLQNTEIKVPEDDEAFLKAEEIRISLDLSTLILSRKIVPGRTRVSGVAATITRTADGAVMIQGRLLAEWLKLRGGNELSIDDIPDTTLWLQDVALLFTDDFLQRPETEFRVSAMVAELDDGELRFAGEIEPEQRFGRNVSLSVEIPLAPLLDKENSIGSAEWQLQVNVPDLDISEWLALLPDEFSPITSGSGSGVINARLRGGIPLVVGADLELNDIRLKEYDREFNRISGEFEFSRVADEWKLSGNNVLLDTDLGVWAGSSLDFGLEPGDKPGSQNLSLRASYLNLGDLSPLMRAIAGKPLAKAGINGELEGEVEGLRLTALLVDAKPEALQIDADFSGLGYIDNQSGIDLRGLNGTLSSNDNEGYLNLRVDDQSLLFKPMFRGAIDVESLRGVVVWRARESGVTLIANGLSLVTPFGGTQASMELSLPFDAQQALMVDLQARANVSDVTALLPIMPKVIPPTVIKWLDSAVIAGRSDGATFRLNGNLREFPFTADESGEFLITVPFEDGELRFAPGWPNLKEASGKLVFDGVSMYSVENQGMLSGTAFENADARIEDLRAGELNISSAVSTRLPAVISFLRNSPLSKTLGPTLAKVNADGEISGRVAIQLPIKNMANWKFDAEGSLVDGRAGLDGLDFGVTELSGDITVRQTKLLSDNLRGQLLGSQVDIRLSDPGKQRQELSQIAILSSVTPIGELAEAFKLPFPDRLSGSAQWLAEARFPSGSDGVKREFDLVVSSDLKGVGIDLPSPVYKSEDVPEPVELIATFPEENRFDLRVDMQRDLHARLNFLKQDEFWRVSGGHINLGDELPAGERTEPGVYVEGQVAELNLSDWLDLGESASEQSGEIQPWYEVFTEFDLFAYELDVFDFSFPQIKIRARGVNGVWLVDAQSDRAEGRLLVPNEFDAGQTLMLDMDRLKLESRDTGDEDFERADPRTLPRLLARVNDFSFSDINLGYLEAEVVKIDNGLKVRRVFSDAGSFTLSLDGDWQLLNEADGVHRTRIKVDLNSTDVSNTLGLLGFDPLVEAKMGNAHADLTWDDVPGMGVLYKSRGNFGFRVENGQIANVDPGGGRLLGLMSLTSLPRRLSLDFRDVFDDGLGFDKLKGSFRLQDGVAHTCDVSLSGSVTDMALIGSSDLESETYNQLAVIRPHMSNMLPLGTAVVAGPAIGAAVLLVATVFKDPLSNIGATYYQISDSWDEPVMDKIDREDIDTQSFEDCAAGLPEFSQADIESLRELQEIANDSVPVDMPSLNEVANEPSAADTAAPENQ